MKSSKLTKPIVFTQPVKMTKFTNSMSPTKFTRSSTPLKILLLMSLLSFSVLSYASVSADSTNHHSVPPALVIAQETTPAQMATPGPFITANHNTNEIIPSAVQREKHPMQVLFDAKKNNRQIIPTPFRVLYAQTLPESWQEITKDLNANETPEDLAKNKSLNYVLVKLEYNRAFTSLPVNDIADYAPFPSFPIKIPSFAKNVSFQAGSYKGGLTQYVQLSFQASPEESQSLIDETRETAQIITTPREAKQFKVILSGEHDKKQIYTVPDANHPTISLDQLIPTYWVSTTSELKDLNDVSYTYWHPEVVSQRLKTEQAHVKEIRKARAHHAPPMVLQQIHAKWRDVLSRLQNERPADVRPMTVAENKAAQMKYLGHLSYETFTHNIPDTYTVYIYAYGGTNGPNGEILWYADGLAVSPDKTHLIFYNIDTYNESLLVE